MKFKFSLEVLLKHRARLEELARKDFLMAQNAADESMLRINQMWQDIDNVRLSAMEIQHRGGSSAQLLATMDEFINGHKVRIEREKKRFRDLQLFADEKKDLLIEAAKEFKILEKLKEKRK